MTVSSIRPPVVALLAAVPCAIAVGAAASLAGPKVAIVPVLVAWLWLLTTSYGAVGVVAPAFLFPHGLGPGTTWGTTLLVGACIYWATGAGRPRISLQAAGAVAVLSCLLFAKAFGRYPLVESMDVAIVGLGGVVLGTCLAASPRAIVMVGLFCTGPALLALWEVSGNSNFWVALVGSDPDFARLATTEGAERALSTFGHPLIAGDILAVVAVLVLGTDSRWRMPIAAILIAGVIATVSRSAVAALAAGLLVLLALQGGRRFVWTVSSLAGIALVAWVVIVSTPTLERSFNERFNDRGGQVVREYGRDQLVSALSNPQDHLVGGGYFESVRFMEQRPIQGFTIFDNWYPTAIWDYGFIPLLIVGALVFWGALEAQPAARRLAIPALVVLAVALFFTDGQYWTSMRLTAGVLVGVLTYPGVRLARGSREAKQITALRPR